MTDDALAAAESRLRGRIGGAAPEDGQWPETWNPRGDDEPLIVGRLLGVESVPTRYGDSEVATLERADGTRRAVWLSARTLAGAWERTEPQVGEVVAVRFCGMRHTADGGHEYGLFTLAVDRPEEGGPAGFGDDPPF